MQPIVSIDIETLGLNPENCLTIELAAIIDFDGQSPIEDLPRFESYITHEVYCGEPFALQMNAQILKEICNLNEKQLCDTRPEYVMGQFSHFLANNLPKGEKKYTPAGKNFAGFDKGFLEKLPKYREWVGRLLAHRTIDPGNLYWIPSEDGFVLPDTKKCLERAGLEATNSHRALGDAIDVVRLIRHKYKYLTDKCISVKEVKMPESAQKVLNEVIDRAFAKY